MYKLFLAGALGLLLGACSGQGDAPPASSQGDAVTAASAPAADNPEEITPPRSAAELSAEMLDKAIDSKARTAEARAQDKVRHPRQVLTFFGLRPDMNVIEVDPADGWYAAILAPLLRDNGTYTAAVTSTLDTKQADGATRQSLRALFDTHPDRYGRARLAAFDPHTPNLGTPGSADMVLSLRSLHVWVDEDRADTMLRAVYDVLAPGGVFGVVEKRAPDDAGSAASKEAALRQKDVVAMAERAGFHLDAQSDVNAVPGDADAGDDRMTLRFVKPSKPAHAASR